VDKHMGRGRRMDKHRRSMDFDRWNERKQFKHREEIT